MRANGSRVQDLTRFFNSDNLEYYSRLMEYKGLVDNYLEFGIGVVKERVSDTHNFTYTVYVDVGDKMRKMLVAKSNSQYNYMASVVGIREANEGQDFLKKSLGEKVLLFFYLLYTNWDEYGELFRQYIRIKTEVRLRAVYVDIFKDWLWEFSCDK